MPGLVIGAIAGVSMAYFGYGVWSLVAMQLSTQGVISLVIWVKSDWKPQLVFSTTKIKKHWNFGYKLMVSSVMSSVFRELYSVVIAKNFSIVTLGYYNRARTYSSYPVNMISQVISRVSYPMLVQLKDDREKVSQIYKKLIRSVFFLVTPVMFALAVVAEPLFIFVFTDKWLPAVPYFQILSLSLILMPIHSFNLNVFKVYDRTDLHLKLALIKKIVMGGVVVIGFFFGMTAMLWGIVASSFIGLLLNTSYSEELIGYKTTEQIKDLTPTFITALISSAAGFYLLSLMKSSPLLLQIFVIPLCVIGAFLALNILIKNKSFKELIELIKMVIGKRKTRGKKPL
jgi:O-antigen/teichoic acid export membrane protein